MPGGCYQDERQYFRILTRSTRMKAYHLIFMAQIAGLVGLIAAAVLYW